MTEQEWLITAKPRLLLEARRWKSGRKLRLFACACCRRVWDWITEDVSRRAVQVAEWSADGAADQHMLRAIEEEAQEFSEDLCLGARDHFDTYAVYRAASAASRAAEASPLDGADSVTWSSAEAAASIAARHAWDEDHLSARNHPDFFAACDREEAAQAELFRDIFGNPFRPVVLRPEWRTPTAVSLAQSAYEERKTPSGELDAARLAVLSDALEEAGCSDAYILAHLRSPGPHARGCWPVDLLLARE